MANLQNLAQQVTDGKALVLPFLKEKKSEEDPNEISHLVATVTKYDPDSGQPFTISEKLPSEAEIIKVIEATQRDLDGLNATLALIRGVSK